MASQFALLFCISHKNTSTNAGVWRLNTYNLDTGRSAKRIECSKTVQNDSFHKVFHLASNTVSVWHTVCFLYG